MNKKYINKYFYLGVLLIIFVLYLFDLQTKDLAKRNLVINDQILSVEIADQPALQAQGLSGRKSLALDQGMLFIFPEKEIQTFWMKDMHFDIDLLWIVDDQIIAWEKEMSAVETTEQLVTSPQPVDKVLELSAKSIERLDIAIGDKIYFID